MKTLLDRPTMALLLGMLACMRSSGGGAEADARRVQFREVDTLFANPGQGWMSQQRTPRTDPRFPCSVVYLRFDWADAEPEQGQFNWRFIDEVIDAWKPRGAAVAMRVMTCNAHSAGYYSSPKWLFDAGCKGFEYLVGGDDPTSGGKRIPRIEPDYADPIYLERHGAFLEALGRRYDGHPDVEFLDIGSYGVWGEWHTKHPAPVGVRQQIVDRYLQAFRQTPLVFMSDDAEVLNHALAHGAGFRRDGVGSPWHEQNWIGSKKYAEVTGLAETWKRAPVVFEWFGDYAYLESRQWSFNAAVDFMLGNHVTLINDNLGRVPPEAVPQLEKLARLAGARFVLRELEHERSVKSGGRLNLRMKWANVGVGKLHRTYALRLLLLDAAGHPRVTADAMADPRTWLPGEHRCHEVVPIPAALEAGKYTVAVALVDPRGQRPHFRLAMDAPEQDGRYALSEVQVSNARELVFGGYTWTIRSGHGGPGPNAWEPENVWLDAATNLHLKIAHRAGQWSCAEVTLQQRLGFGQYQFQTIGRIDRLDDNVVLGLFNYPTRDVGSDATHEIDIEFARWGEARNPMGNFTVWPVERHLKQVSKTFPVVLTGDESTHRFTWSDKQVVFQSVHGHREDGQEAISAWTYAPSEPARFISRQSMPVHLNLWLFQGRPPKDGQEVEVIIRGFSHDPGEPSQDGNGGG